MISNSVTRRIKRVTERRKQNDNNSQLLVIGILESAPLFAEEFFQGLFSLNCQSCTIKWAIWLNKRAKMDQRSLQKWLPDGLPVQISGNLADILDQHKAMDLILFVNSSAIVEEPGSMLSDLMEQTVDIVAPLLRTNGDNDLWHQNFHYDQGWNRSGSTITPFHESIKKGTKLKKYENEF